MHKDRYCERSDNHLGFTRLVKNGKTFERIRIDDHKVKRGDEEFFVGPSGLSVKKVPVENKIKKLRFKYEKKHGAIRCRENSSSVNLSGPYQIVEFCRLYRFVVPECTRRIINKYDVKINGKYKRTDNGEKNNNDRLPQVRVMGVFRPGSIKL